MSREARGIETPVTQDVARGQVLACHETRYDCSSIGIGMRLQPNRKTHFPSGIGASEAPVTAPILFS